MHKSYIVDDDFNDSRLDKWFKNRILNLPHSLLEKILRQRKVKVNKKKAKSSYRLQKGDLIEIYGISKLKPVDKKEKIKYLPKKKEIGTYDDYIIKASRVVPTTDGAYIRMFTSDQNGGNMTQGWYSDGIYQRMDNGSIARAGYLANQTYWDIIGGAAIGTASGETATYTVYLNNVNNSSQGGTTAQTHWVAHNSNNYYYHGTHSAYLDQGVATNYIRLYFSSGNIASGTFRLYGLAK